MKHSRKLGTRTETKNNILKTAQRGIPRKIECLGHLSDQSVGNGSSNNIGKHLILLQLKGDELSEEIITIV